jgi:hypothetical protein
MGKLVLRKTILRNMIDRVWAALCELDNEPPGSFKNPECSLSKRSQLHGVSYSYLVI